MLTGPNGGGGGGTGPAGAGAGAPSLSSVIPESYREKDWVKQNTKDPESFFKFVDNLNTTIGKKGVIVPGEKATPEEMRAFHSALGVPAKPEEYEFVDIEELKGSKRIPETDAAVKKIMHEAGIPKESAKKLQAGFEKFMFQAHKKMLDENKVLDEAFDAATTKLFGDKKEVAIANAKKLISENTPPEIIPIIDKLDNNSLLILTATLEGITKKYIKEDGFSGGPGAGGSGAETYEGLSAQQRELMKNPAFTNYNHADHEKVMAQNKVIMDRMRAIKK
jgi:hypothetical protein